MEVKEREKSMHKTTVRVIQWIWGEPDLADLMRDTAKGDEFEYGESELVSLIASFVFPEDRSRGIRAWLDISGNEDRVKVLYEALTEGRKTPAGRLEWLSELEPDLVRDALLGHKGDSDIYVHATKGRFHPNNTYRVHDKGTVYERGWRDASGAWGLPEQDRQVCPSPSSAPCGCTVVQRG